MSHQSFQTRSPQSSLPLTEQQEQEQEHLLRRRSVAKHSSIRTSLRDDPLCSCSTKETKGKQSVGFEEQPHAGKRSRCSAGSEETFICCSFQEKETPDFQFPSPLLSPHRRECLLLLSLPGPDHLRSLWLRDCCWQRTPGPSSTSWKSHPRAECSPEGMPLPLRQGVTQTEIQLLSPGTSRYRKSLRQPLHRVWTFSPFPSASLEKIHRPFGLLQPAAERSSPFITGTAAERTSQSAPPSLLG